MGKFTVKQQPSGCINGQLWPEVGEEIELDDAVGNDMVGAGWLEAVKAKPAKKVEKRPASKQGEETR